MLKGCSSLARRKMGPSQEQGVKVHGTDTPFEPFAARVENMWILKDLLRRDFLKVLYVL